MAADQVAISAASFVLPADERSREGLARAICRSAWCRGLDISHEPDLAGMMFKVAGDKMSIVHFVSRTLTVYGK